ncbi:hypothetical protein D4764_0170060 [Takifugu flavidus]|uniref:Uncharacterized protein n=1 Tax=Takifugu flavidus TaxID=433684 RepID=A0A5C6MD55_9TELE|nr:hypothetical protein D4764_0170060 [Takifugu flavidus]
MQNSDVFHVYLCESKRGGRERGHTVEHMDCRTGLLLLTICWAGVDAQTLTQSEPVVKDLEISTLTCFSREQEWIAYISSQYYSESVKVL